MYVQRNRQLPAAMRHRRENGTAPITIAASGVSARNACATIKLADLLSDANNVDGSRQSRQAPASEQERLNSVIRNLRASQKFR